MDQACLGNRYSWVQFGADPNTYLDLVNLHVVSQGEAQLSVILATPFIPAA